jgi:hypothetical protein
VSLISNIKAPVIRLDQRIAGFLASDVRTVEARFKEIEQQYRNEIASLRANADGSRCVDCEFELRSAYEQSRWLPKSCRRTRQVFRG